MKGYLAVIQVTGDITVTEHSAPLDLGVLQTAVGGYIETVPFFDKFQYAGVTYPAVAFCNEEGKLNGQQINIVASQLWFELFTVGTDVLVGPVAVAFGDEEFMNTL